MIERQASWNVTDLLEQAGWIRKLSRSLAADPHAAEDLEQETWVAALSADTGSLSSPRGWLHGVMRNLSLQGRRSAGRRADRQRAAARPEVQPSSDAVAERIELQKKLAGAVLSLDEPYRSTIALRYFEGLSVRKIAARQGVSTRGVETRLRRGLERLREKLDQLHGGKREEWFGTVVALGALDPAGKPAVVAAAAAALLMCALGVTYAVWPGEPGETARDVSLVLPAAGEPGSLSAEPAAIPPGSPDERVEVAAADSAGITTSVRLVGEGGEEPLVALELDISVSGGGATSPWQQVTDDEGRFVFEWQEGWQAVHLEVPSTGRTRSWQGALEAAGDHLLRIPRRLGTVEGLAVDLAGNPVPFAEVRVWLGRRTRQDVPWEHPDRVVQADQAGRFKLEQLADGDGGRRNCRLTALAPGMFAVHSLSTTLSWETHLTDCRIVLGPAWEIRGHVVSTGGATVADVPIIAYTWANESSKLGWNLRRHRPQGGKVSSYRPLSIEVHSASDGTFAFPITSEPWHLQVDHSDFQHWEDWIEDDGFFEILLTPGSELVGRCVDEHGKGLADVQVFLMCKDKRGPVTTDSSGRFAFDHLTPVEGVNVSFLGEGLATHVETLDLPSGPIEVELTPQAVLGGRILHQDGRPAEKLQVKIVGDRIVSSKLLPRHRGLAWESLSRNCWTFTDADGRWEFDRLYPGTFEVTVRNYPDRETLAFARVDSGRGALDLILGEGLEGMVHLRGSAIGPDGRPLRKFTVHAQSWLVGETQPANKIVQRSFEDPSGLFDLGVLAPGEWSVHFWGSAGGTQLTWAAPREQMAAGTHMLEAKLIPGVSVVPLVSAAADR